MWQRDKERKGSILNITGIIWLKEEKKRERERESILYLFKGISTFVDYSMPKHHD